MLVLLSFGRIQDLVLPYPVLWLLAKGQSSFPAKQIQPQKKQFGFAIISTLYSFWLEYIFVVFMLFGIGPTTSSCGNGKTSKQQFQITHIDDGVGEEQTRLSRDCVFSPSVSHLRKLPIFGEALEAQVHKLSSSDVFWDVSHTWLLQLTIMTGLSACLARWQSGAFYFRHVAFVPGTGTSTVGKDTNQIL